MEAATTRRFGHRGVFVYMPTRGINLYPVKPAAASIQRLLVSLFGYLANENYDLTSTRFYCITGTLVFPSLLPFLLRPRHFLSPTPAREGRNQKRWPAHPSLPLPLSLSAFVIRFSLLAIILPARIDISVEVVTVKITNTRVRRGSFFERGRGGRGEGQMVSHMDGVEIIIGGAE